MKKKLEKESCSVYVHVKRTEGRYFFRLSTSSIKSMFEKSALKIVQEVKTVKLKETAPYFGNMLLAFLLRLR